jgi:hypothetical protein
MQYAGAKFIALRRSCATSLHDDTTRKVGLCLAEYVGVLTASGSTMR